MVNYSALLSSKGVRWIGLGWTGFILENVVMSHNRDWIIENFGSDKYHGVYNVLSTAACGSIFYGYVKHGRGMGPYISSIPPLVMEKVINKAKAVRGLPAVAAAFALQVVGFGILSQQIP